MCFTNDYIRSLQQKNIFVKHKNTSLGKNGIQNRRIYITTKSQRCFL